MDTLILNADGAPLSMLPFSCVSWQTSIRLLSLGKVKLLKEYDDWSVRSPSITMAVPSVVMTTEYIKWNRQIKYSRNNVFLRDAFTCQYCGKSPTVHSLTIDHVVPRSHGGGTSWNNVTTACKKCNSDKGNDASIVPKSNPRKPSYYELIAMRKKYPIRIRDEYWQNYIQWPEELIRLTPPTHGVKNDNP